MLLISKAAGGDEKSFSDLAERYRPLLEGMSKKYAGMSNNGKSFEEDFFQEATLAFYSAVCSYTESDKVTFGLYAKICVRNRLVSYLRSVSVKGKKHLSEKAGYADPIGRLVEKEDVKEIENKIQSRLSDFEWEVFRLYIQRRSYSDIAKVLGRTEKSVDNAIYRIKTKLKGLI